jgi:DNA-binding response OmpR family regulator
MRILVIEDEIRLADIIRRGLVEAGYAVDLSHDGEEGEYLAETFPYDLILLDIILPKKDGFEICVNLRRNKVNVRILMLTCKDTVSDRVKGLDAGADDYLIKPFAFSELLARIRAVFRRNQVNGSPVLEAGELTMNTSTHEVKRGNKAIDLTTKEYSLLEYLMRNPNIVITRSMLEEHIWDMSFESESNLIEVYIRRIRQKIDNDGESSFIETIRGVGYRLRT